MLRRHILPAIFAIVMMAPLPANAGGLPEICADIGPDVINLLNRYAAADAPNFCIRAMTLAETRCFRQRDQVIREANVISRRYNLAPVIPGCQPPVLLAAAPVYQPPAPILATGAREAVSHASLFRGSWWLLGLLPLVGLAFIGGGGGDSSTSTTATNIPDEFNAQYSLAIIGARTAYQRGFTGQGVRVAVLDTGIDVSHPEFAGRIINPFDFTTNSAGMGSNTTPHGTQVAGVLAASRNFNGMHGVAYNALIQPLRVFDGSNNPISGSFAPAINYAISSGTRIINGSYGPDRNWHDNSNFFNYQLISDADKAEGAAYVAAAQAGAILVFGAGDYYGSFPNVGANPTGPGFLPFIKTSNNSITGVANGAYRNLNGSVVTQDFSAMIPNTIVVVGTKRDGTIMATSNRCGVAAAWCMAAPAENIFTTNPNGTYTTVSGTSYAAPQVSGAAAILKQQFPSLTGSQIVSLLLNTATDLGASGVDAIYGHGMLNLARATQPVGGAGIALTSDVNGQRSSLQDSALSFGTAFGITASDQIGSKEIAFLDGYDRAYTTELKGIVRMAGGSFNTDKAVFEFGTDEDRTELKVNDSMTLAFTNETSNADTRFTSSKPVAEGDSDFGVRGFVVTDELGKDTKASVHYRDPGALALGFSEADRGRMDRALVKSNLQNPYAAFAATHGYASIIETEAMGAKVKVAGFFGRPEKTTDARNFGSQAEATYDLGAGSKVMVSFGTLFENSSVLGSTGTGAFAFGNGTMTVYSGLGTSLNLDSKTTLRGAAYAGYTKPSLSNDSLITGMSNLVTTAFNIGLDRADVASKGDRLSIGVAQPIRVEGGSMQFNLPYARDAESATVYTTSLTQDFGKQGREIDLELNYAMSVDEQTKLSFGALYRHDAGHEAGNSDMLGVVRLSKKF